MSKDRLQSATTTTRSGPISASSSSRRPVSGCSDRHRQGADQGQPGSSRGLATRRRRYRGGQGRTGAPRPRRRASRGNVRGAGSSSSPIPTAIAGATSNVRSGSRLGFVARTVVHRRRMSTVLRLLILVPIGFILAIAAAGFTVALGIFGVNPSSDASGWIILFAAWGAAYAGAFAFMPWLIAVVSPRASASARVLLVRGRRRDWRAAYLFTGFYGDKAEAGSASPSISPRGLSPASSIGWSRTEFGQAASSGRGSAEFGIEHQPHRDLGEDQLDGEGPRTPANR